MNAVMREYILKGLFLGLWAYLALIQPDWPAFARVVAWTAGGLGVGVVAAAVFQLVRGYRPGRNPVGFLLLVLLDGSFFIYLGVVGGLAAGLILGRPPEPPPDEAVQAVAGATAAAGPPIRDWLGWFALGGAVLGFGFYQLSQVRDWLYRFALGLVVGGVLVYLAISYLEELKAFGSVPAQRDLGLMILAALPFFYLLTFTGEAEESEVEIAALCAGLGIGLFLLRFAKDMPYLGDKAVFLVPVVLYFVYSTRVLPGMRVFKHTLRGYGNVSLGRVRDALVSFDRALALDPKNQLAAQGMYQLHRRLDVAKLDDTTIRLLNFDIVLALAERLVIQDRPPTEAERAEAVRLLDMVEQYRPALRPRADYLRAVTQTHAKDFDLAAGYLARLLDPETYPGEARDRVLFPAWDLALRLHPEIVSRLGERELAKPGRRVEAIAAVERQLAKTPDDPTAVELKRVLYAGLTEAEYVAAAATAPPAEFNYEYVEQLGLALVDESERSRQERGMEYLRIAGRGLPQRGPGIFTRLADLSTKLGDADAARGYLEQVKRAGLTAGPRNLPADQRELYLAALKRLSEEAANRENFQAAVDDYRLYVEAGKEDANTLRHLAELYARNGDPLNALLIVERGLLYAKTDADLLKKKDSYYYSVDVEKVRSVKDKVSSWFDVAYCVRRARAVADQRDLDLDTIDYGLHLTRLAQVINPDSHSVRLAEAHLLLRKGEQQQALAMLEDIRQEKKGSGDEEDAWYLATKLLGQMYLNELDRADLAIQCFNDFKEFHKSGADTLYELGRAYEAAGNVPAAIRNYEAVTAYQNHPRYYDATEAVRRLKGG